MSKETSSPVIGFAGMLAIIFIGLKLGHVITWSWLWVLAPIWIWVPLIVLIGLLAVALG